MEAITKRKLRSKNGNEISAGVKVNVTSNESGTKAIVAHRDFKINVPMIRIGKYLRGFLTITEVSTAYHKAEHNPEIVKSMTGERVEPDGWDSKGFPSVLLAGGYV